MVSVLSPVMSSSLDASHASLLFLGGIENAGYNWKEIKKQNVMQGRNFFFSFSKRKCDMRFVFDLINLVIFPKGERKPQSENNDSFVREEKGNKNRDNSNNIDHE